MMDQFRTFYDSHGLIFWLVLLLILILLSVWIYRVQRRNHQLQARMDDLFGATSSENMARMLVEYLGTVRSTAASVARMKAEHDQIAGLLPSVIRHVGLIRFSPFHDTGGDQSFAVALLDGKGDGVVLTALHSRTDSRLYAKPIEHYGSTYSLTPEEREAIDRAIEREPAETRS
jgi:cbb3-type cytochrome oxidase subunit 3